MAFTDQLKKVASDTVNSVGKFATNVSDSSKKLAEKTKLKSKIKNEESIINGIYLTMGKICFESNGEATKEKYSKHIEDINTHLAEIQNLNARISALEGMTTCPNCGKQVESDAKFCANCGASNANYVEPTETHSEEETPEPTPVTPAETNDADVYVGSEDEN